MPISKVGSKGIKDAELTAADIAPGTITSAKIAPGTIASDRLAGGITNAQLAGSIANDKLANSSTTINGTAIALQGRVPCKVKGIVRKGDLITTSNIPGVGTKMNKDLYEIGCVIGKALEDHNSAEQGVIEVVVGRV